MKITRLSAAVISAVLLCHSTASAQYLYKFLFHGISYQTNSSGNIVATPITEQTLLQDRAQAEGITDLSNMVIAYHFAGDEKGDTVEIINTVTGTKYFELGFWFGDDISLG